MREKGDTAAEEDDNELGDTCTRILIVSIGNVDTICAVRPMAPHARFSPKDSGAAAVDAAARERCRRPARLGATVLLTRTLPTLALAIPRATVAGKRTRALMTHGCCCCCCRCGAYCRPRKCGARRQSLTPLTAVNALRTIVVWCSPSASADGGARATCAACPHAAPKPHTWQRAPPERCALRACARVVPNNPRGCARFGAASSAMSEQQQPSQPSQQPRNTLNALSQNALRGAVTRARKRARSVQSAQHVPLSPTVHPAPHSPPHRQPYHKRRKTSLIPHADVSDEDESNDEWEEHVHIDQRTVHALGASAPVTRRNEPSEPHHKHRHPPTPASPSSPRKPLSPQQKSKAQRKLNAALRKSRLRVHSVHLVLLASHLLRQDAAANDALCRALALSVVPENVFLHARTLKHTLARFALWMRSTFHSAALVTQHAHLRSQSVFTRACNATERLALCARHSRGDIIDVAALACAFVRSQRFRCRLVMALQPVPFRVKNGKNDLAHTARHLVIDARASDITETVLYAWIEVWSPQHSVWMVVDVFSGQTSHGYSRDAIDVGLLRIPVFDHKFMHIETSQHPTYRRSSSRRQSTRRSTARPTEDPVRRVSEQYYSHVVAVENGRLTDVSRRYVRNWLQAEDCRARGNVFENVLSNLSTCSDVKGDYALQKEQEEFESIAAEETVPTTMTAVQKHPRYVLERHIKKYELIWPREPVVGYIKEEPIFLRANVKLLHTKDRWIRQMRKVKQNAQPMKSVKSKNGTDAQVQLFGEWQTEPLKIAPCKDGKVPRGVHGNVDLWTADHLPDGAEHVNVPYAKMAARKVGVDFAPAMTGFDIRGGRSIPRIEGVVVAVENADLVRDGAREISRAAQERAERRARDDALARWAKLLRAVKMGQKVKKKYGGVSSSTFEADQKRKGLEKAAREKSGSNGLQTMKERAEVDVQAAANKLKLSKEHQHVFDEGVHVEGDTWVKKCTVCDLEVSYERL
eukprot:TRINITY_DN641_c0_g1_i1.p1 TRINITY_DN641_c0_g1~~TRINITY_DN641_c0_g1_i1.p1  ORF type:complete len:982 (+),score=176.22 TRINITY_DN641_c0_g1_i1:1101-4046(+)